MTAFADLAHAQAWVFDLQKYGIKFGLSSTLNLLARLGIPYDRGRYLHLAGTNGKGSVAAMLSAILTRAGYPVGLFTSPHLVRFGERFRLRDEDIGPAALLELINRVRQAMDEAEPPTFFEFAAAMAFLYFHQQGARPVILETGMGGRLDATNIVQPLVSVITNISLDHQFFLGDTLSAIAGEKAGIIKAGAPLVTYARQKRVLDLFRRRCLELGAPFYLGGVDFKTRGHGNGHFSYQGLKQRLDKLTVNLRGPSPIPQRRGGPGRGGTPSGHGLCGAGAGHPGGPGKDPLAGPPDAGAPGPPGHPGRGPQPGRGPLPGPGLDSRTGARPGGCWSWASWRTRTRTPFWGVSAPGPHRDLHPPRLLPGRQARGPGPPGRALCQGNAPGTRGGPGRQTGPGHGGSG
jgi:hypothetical protein